MNFDISIDRSGQIIPFEFVVMLLHRLVIFVDNKHMDQ